MEREKHVPTSSILTFPSPTSKCQCSIVRRNYRFSLRGKFNETHNWGPYKDGSHWWCLKALKLMPCMRVFLLLGFSREILPSPLWKLVSQYWSSGSNSKAREWGAPVMWTPVWGQENTDVSVHAGRQEAKGVNFFLFLGRQWTRRCPPTLRRAIYSTEATDSNTYYSHLKTLSQIHQEISVSSGNFWHSQLDT